MSNALVIEGLSKSFNASSSPVLKNVHLSLQDGSCTAVLGPSGSGKSTLLRTVAGLETLDSGRIVLRGTNLAGVSTERRGMAMVSQRPLLFPHLNVLDNVAFAATVRGVRRRRARADAAQFLELMQLESYGHRPISALSGGQAQRVAIARALAARPTILLLDEPFSALDQELRSTMHELLAQLREQLGPTILMVTHDREEAAAVADNIALLSHGKLLQHDRVELMYSRPKSLEVHRLMGGTNEITGTVRDGVHYSALGDLDLPADTERINGPAVMVIRQESISIQSNTQSLLETGVPAIVKEIRVLGPRRQITVDAKGITLQAEGPWGLALSPGDAITLAIPVSARALIPAPLGAASASTPDIATTTITSGATS